MKNLELIGNIGKMDMKYTPEGKAVLDFTVAVNVKVKGEKVTEWYKCVAWEKAAELINQYSAVGSKIFVAGEPKVEAWNDKASGNARAQIALTVKSFEFLSKTEHRSESDNMYAEGDLPDVQD